MAYGSRDIDQDTFVTAFKWMLGFIVCLTAIACFIDADPRALLQSLFHRRKDPPPPRLAAEGTFYVLNYISAQTRGGVVGFEPGTAVRLVRPLEAKGKLLVTDGHYEAEASPLQLTNDLDVADLVRSRDASSQQQLAAYVSDQSQQLAQLRQEQDVAHSTNVGRYSSAAAQSSIVGNMRSHLNDAPQMTRSTASGSGTQMMIYTPGSPISYLQNPYARGGPFSK